MITWLQLSPAARIARHERTLRVAVAAASFAVCFLVGFLV